MSEAENCYMRAYQDNGKLLDMYSKQDWIIKSAYGKQTYKNKNSHFLMPFNILGYKEILPISFANQTHCIPFISAR